MIEIKDEIIAGEPRYRLKDNNGNIVMDNLSIEQITPVVQEGTPINKMLFDDINANISRASKFNIPTMNLSLTKFEKDFKGGWVQEGDNLITKENMSVEFSNANGNVKTNTLLDIMNSLSPASITLCDHNSKTGNIIVDFGEKSCFNIDFFCYSEYGATFTISVSNDKIDWTSLHSEKLDASDYETGLNYGKTNIVSEDGYRYIRVSANGGSGYYSGDIHGIFINWVRPFECNGDDYLSINTPLKSYEDGQIINMLLPNNFCKRGVNTWLKIGNLPYKKINAELDSNYMISLKFNLANDVFETINCGQIIRSISIFARSGDDGGYGTNNATGKSIKIIGNKKNILLKSIVIDGTTYNGKCLLLVDVENQSVVNLINPSGSANDIWLRETTYNTTKNSKVGFSISFEENKMVLTPKVQCTGNTNSGDSFNIYECMSFSICYI